jgi:hypothetical protein
MEIKTVLLTEPVGLGDMVSAATKKLGIQPCNACKKRAEMLNAMMQFTPREDPWATVLFPVLAEGWFLMQSHETPGNHRIMCQRMSDGYVMIWQITPEGKYRDAKGFCCSETMRSRIQATWDEVCR